MAGVEQQMCPFCQALLPDDEGSWKLTQHGSGIGGIDSCAECAALVTDEESAREMIAMLRRQEEAS